MSSELQILAAFCESRELYEEYYEYISGVKNLERELKVLLHVVNEFYSEFSKSEKISRDEFITYYDIVFPAQRDRDVHLDLIHQMYQLKINPDLISKILESILERHFSSIVLHKLIPIVEGTESGKLVEVYEDIEAYLRRLKNPPQKLNKLKPCELSIRELIDTEINYEGLNWHLPVLDDTIGRVKRKKLGLIYAFVDSGKSSFCISATANFARQLVGTDKCIVYAGNEEGAPGLSLRLTQSMLRRTKSQIVEDPDWAEEERAKLGFHHVKLYDSVYTLNDVVYLLEEHRPRVIFIDQAVKVEGDAKDENIKAIQKLFNTYRELAKTFDTTIIGVAQGRGECEDKKYLNLSDIYGSRVAIQGELDWALGIGRVLDPIYEKQRYINIPKNKEGENSRFVVNFDRHLCLWEEG